MSDGAPTELDIVVSEKLPTDSALTDRNGVRTLVLRPQTFGSAVRHVRNVLPHIPQEAAERMLREQCPELRDIDTLLGLNQPTPPSVERPRADDDNRDKGQAQRARWRRNAVIVAALLPALAASYVLGRVTSDDSEAKAPGAGAADREAADSNPAAHSEPFDDKKFEFFEGSSKIACRTISALQAECTDADGMVMSTVAATGPESTIFMFSYGTERIGLRIFYDAAYANTWARQDGTKELYPDLRVHGRYVMWGTDPLRIGEYMGLIEKEDREGRSVAMGGATPLPPRLAALTLGTLGVDRHEMSRLIASPAAVMDGAAIMAARLVLGLDTVPAMAGQDGDDIVALAAGLDPGVPTNDGKAVLPDTTFEPSSPPVVSPSTHPATPVTETRPPVQTTPPPVSDTPPSTEPVDSTPSEPETPVTPPVEETPPSTEPVDSTPSEPETPVTPPVEETPQPPTTSPVEETPAEPVGQTPVSPAESPAAEPTPPPDTVDQADDLLIMDSAWRVAA